MDLPDAGDVLWVDLDDTRGTEQSGRRPALVLSSRIYHQVSGRAIICPISRTARSWPSNIKLPEGLITAGSVLCDQIRTIDRTNRAFGFIETVPESVTNEVRDTVASLIGIEIYPLVPSSP